MDNAAYIKQLDMMLDFHLESGIATATSISVFYTFYMAVMPLDDYDKWSQIHARVKDWYVKTTGKADGPSWGHKIEKIKKAAWSLYEKCVTQTNKGILK